MTPLDLINKYYAHNPRLRNLLLKHSQQVANRALAVADQHPELALDRTFLYEAAMLHDVGIFLTKAPGIFCYGAEPYIRHGYLGANLMRREGLSQHALVCERHTGTGLTREIILAQRLPLPADRIFTPQSLEEQVICFADKFYSKSNAKHVKTPEEVLTKLAKFGQEGVKRFEEWLTRFG